MDEGEKIWMSTGLDRVAKVNNGIATCISNHLTVFGVTPALPEDEVPGQPGPVDPTDPDGPTDPTVPEDDDSDYDYNFWGCMNAFYVGLILWFFYFVLAAMARKRDKEENMLPADSRLTQVISSSPRGD
jgi:hypothetical protein